jgi:hypothetical protein
LRQHPLRRGGRRRRDGRGASGAETRIVQSVPGSRSTRQAVEGQGMTGPLAPPERVGHCLGCTARARGTRPGEIQTVPGRRAGAAPPCQHLSQTKGPKYGPPFKGPEYDPSFWQEWRCFRREFSSFPVSSDASACELLWGSYYFRIQSDLRGSSVIFSKHLPSFNLFEQSFSSWQPVDFDFGRWSCFD